MRDIDIVILISIDFPMSKDNVENSSKVNNFSMIATSKMTNGVPAVSLVVKVGGKKKFTARSF